MEDKIRNQKTHDILDHLTHVIDEDLKFKYINPKTWPSLSPFEKNLIQCLCWMIEANAYYFDREKADSLLQSVWERIC